MPNAVCQRIDEVLDSSCDGASVPADLSDVIQHGCNDKLRLTRSVSHQEEFTEDQSL